jgi:hypothetical protein
MLNPEHHTRFTELAAIVQVVQVAVGSPERTYRVEALCDIRSGVVSTQVYIEKAVGPVVVSQFGADGAVQHEGRTIHAWIPFPAHVRPAADLSPDEAQLTSSSHTYRAKYPMRRKALVLRWLVRCLNNRGDHPCAPEVTAPLADQRALVAALTELRRYSRGAPWPPGGLNGVRRRVWVCLKSCGYASKKAFLIGQ